MAGTRTISPDINDNNDDDMGDPMLRTIQVDDEEKDKKESIRDYVLEQERWIKKAINKNAENNVKNIQLLTISNNLLKS